MAYTIYNLDNPWLAYYYTLNPPTPSNEIMCSFLALRTPYPLTWPMDLSQFGTIISEVPERLEIHLTDKELERIDELKQAWVSKYAEEGMVCHVRFGHFEPDLSRTLVFQQGYKIPRDPRKANVTTSSTVPVMSGQARRFQSQSSELEWTEQQPAEETEEQAQAEEQVEEHIEELEQAVWDW